MTPETRALLQAGKLEQSCPDCGRWEASGFECSWCGRRMGPADWYLNHDLRERHGRRPRTAPANPPTEYRKIAAWPAEWGPCPYVKPSPISPPVTATPEPEAVYTATGGTFGL